MCPNTHELRKNLLEYSQLFAYFFLKKVFFSQYNLFHKRHTIGDLNWSMVELLILGVPVNLEICKPAGYIEAKLNQLKMTGFTFKGSNSKFYLLSSIGIKSLIDRICSSESDLFPLRVDPSFNACRKSQSKTKLTHGGVPIYLKKCCLFPVRKQVT